MKTRRESGIKGMTIAELMISLGIFSLVATTATAIFVQLIKTSRLITTKSTAIDNLSLTVEQIAREIRTGKSFSKTENKYDVNSTKLIFMNYRDKKVIYEFYTDPTTKTGVITRQVQGEDVNPVPITASGVSVSGYFFITDFGNQTTPRITVSSVAKDIKGLILARAQTTVGARLIYYKQ